MFFRFWFLILSKVVIVLGLFVFVGMAIGGLLETIAYYAAYLLFAFGLWGAALAIYLLFINGKMKCPVCDLRGDFVPFGKQPAIECHRCGLVYVRNLFLDLDVTVEPHVDDVESDQHVS